MRDKKQPPPLPADPNDRTDLIVQTAQSAVQAAVQDHWRLGQPVAIWRDNRVVWLGPHGEVPPPSDP